MSQHHILSKQYEILIGWDSPCSISSELSGIKHNWIMTTRYGSCLQPFLFPKAAWARLRNFRDYFNHTSSFLLMLLLHCRKISGSTAAMRFMNGSLRD